MAGERLGVSIGIREELIKKVCELDFKAHKCGKLYHREKIRSGGSSSEVVFSFPGSGSVDEWFHGRPFGERKVDLNLFPYLRSVSNNESPSDDGAAAVNEAFFQRFEAILRTSDFANKVEKAVAGKKRIVFSGHSSGGPAAILATLWFLEEYIRQERNQQERNRNLPVCVTFGSPLVGDRIFPHALRREKWDGCFIHFVMRYDVVPRIMLAPLSYTNQQLEQLKPVLHFFNPKSSFFGLESTAREASTFFMNVMTNLSSVASHAACNLMGCTNSLLDTITNFIKHSPYKPFGTYIFCTGNGKLIVVKNSDAVLQLLLYSSQLSSEAEAECREVAYKSLKEHLGYEDELKQSLDMQDVVYLDNHLTELPLSSDGTIQGEIATVNTALNGLGLNTKARLCLRAAGELEEQKKKNQNKINDNKKKIEEKLESIQEYRTMCELSKGYYDAFKLHNEERDFHANVTRLKLVGMWEEITEMLKRYELPDEFEGQPEWIELGTRFRRLVEPLDIANYYRHLKNEDSGPYLVKARPRHYRYTQRWREHAERMPPGSSSESCFLAIVEELRSTNKPLEDKDKILKLETEVLKWHEHKVIGKDVFLDESTFTKWWKTLPDQHRKESCIAQLMTN